MASSIDGLVSGLNTTQIIQQLMAVERLPEQQLTNQQSDAQNLMGILQTLNMKVSSLQTLSAAMVPDAITGASMWQDAVASSSDSSRATAVASSGALAGSVSFAVTSIAAAGAAVSSGTVGATSTVVASKPILVSQGAAKLGFSGFDPGASLSSTSPHTVSVVQSSAAASLTAKSPLQGSVTIDSTNNTFAYYLNGTTPPKTITLTPSGSTPYTPAQLAAELQRASGGDLKASVDSSGTLTVSTAHEGSANTLQIATGTANATLGLTDLATVAKGTDGIISVDQVSQTFTDLYAGQQLTLGGAGTQILGTLASSGLRAGSATATQVSVASSATLADVVNAINGSTAGVSAAAVGVSSSAYRLQLTSKTTGAASDITLNSGAFTSTSGLGVMQQLTAGKDTVLHVGSGIGAYDVTSSTTTVSGLMPNVSITALQADPNTTVTVNVSSDSSGMASKVKAMVDQANSVLGFINDNSGYNSTTKVSGALMGNSLATGIAQQITDAVIGTSSSTPALAGVSVQKDGTLAFDQQAFLDAYAKDPSTVQTSLTSMAQTISNAASQASDPTSGVITQQITSEQDAITQVTKQIADFEQLMTLRQQSLQTTYSNLEVALGNLQSQSSWLGGQLASLPNYSSMTGK